MKKNEFDCLDDYFEEDEAPVLFSRAMEKDLSDVRYEDFNAVTEDYDDDDDDDVVMEYRPVVEKKIVKKTKSNRIDNRIIENEGLMDFLTFFWTWFRRLGIVIMIILSAYYISKGMFGDLFSYLVMLIFAFLFGFGFMALLNKIMDNR